MSLEEEAEKYIEMGLFDIDPKSIGDWNDLYNKLIGLILETLSHIEENTRDIQKTLNEINKKLD